MLVFVEGGKPENPEKNPRNKDKIQQQTQPTYDVESGNRTRATLEGGECSHHCAIPAPPVHISEQTAVNLFMKKKTIGKIDLLISFDSKFILNHNSFLI